MLELPSFTPLHATPAFRSFHENLKKLLDRSKVVRTVKKRTLASKYDWTTVTTVWALFQSRDLSESVLKLENPH